MSEEALILDLKTNGIRFFKRRYESYFHNLNRLNKTTLRSFANDLGKQLPDKSLQNKFVREMLSTVPNPDALLLQDKSYNDKLCISDPLFAKNSPLFKAMVRMYPMMMEFEILSPKNESPNELVAAYISYYLPRSASNPVKTAELLYYLQWMQNHRLNELSVQSKAMLIEGIQLLKKRLSEYFPEQFGEDVDVYDEAETPRIVESHFIGGGFDDVMSVGIDFVLILLYVITVRTALYRLRGVVANAPTPLGNAAADQLGRQRLPQIEYKQDDGQTETRPLSLEVEDNNHYQFVLRSKAKPHTFIVVATMTTDNLQLIIGRRRFYQRFGTILTDYPGYEIHYQDVAGIPEVEGDTSTPAIQKYYALRAPKLDLNDRQTGVIEVDLAERRSVGINTQKELQARMSYWSFERMVMDTMALSFIGVGGIIASLPATADTALLISKVTGNSVATAATLQAAVMTYLLVQTATPIARHWGSYNSQIRTVGDLELQRKSQKIVNAVGTGSVMAMSLYAASTVSAQLAVDETEAATFAIFTSPAALIGTFATTAIATTFGQWGALKAQAVLHAGQANNARLNNGYMLGAVVRGTFTYFLKTWDTVNVFFEEYVPVNGIRGIAIAGSSIVISAVAYEWLFQQVASVSGGLDEWAGEEGLIRLPALGGLRGAGARPPRMGLGRSAQWACYNNGLGCARPENLNPQFNLLTIYFANVAHAHQQISFYLNLTYAQRVTAPSYSLSGLGSRGMNAARVLNSVVGNLAKDGRPSKNGRFIQVGLLPRDYETIQNVLYININKVKRLLVGSNYSTNNSKQFREIIEKKKQQLQPRESIGVPKTEQIVREQAQEIVTYTGLPEGSSEFQDEIRDYFEKSIELLKEQLNDTESEEKYFEIIEDTAKRLTVKLMREGAAEAKKLAPTLTLEQKQAITKHVSQIIL